MEEILNINYPGENLLSVHLRKCIFFSQNKMVDQAVYRNSHYKTQTIKKKESNFNQF